MEEIFIKVFPERLRALIRDKGLTRAEAAELVLLALYIDEDNRCWPGKQDSVEQIGFKSPHWARTLHKHLKRKGALDWDFDHNKRSPHFKLPDAFKFGSDQRRKNGSDSYQDRNSDPFFASDSYQDRNSESRGDRDSESGGVYDSESRGDRDSVPEQEPTRTKTKGDRSKTNHQTGDSYESWNGRVGEPLPVHLYAPLRNLIKAGVNEIEAYLMILQYDSFTIQDAIRDSQGNKNIRNPGAWIRRTVEFKADKKLQYPQATRKQLQALAAMAVVNANTSNPYLEDKYFQGQLDSLEDQDTAAPF